MCGMVSHFSNSYCRGRAHIEVTSGQVGNFQTDVSRLSKNQYDLIDELYANAESTEQPVFKIEGTHFQAVLDTSLPMDTFVLSQEVIQQIERDISGQYADYFVLDPSSEASKRVLEMFDEDSFDASLV